MEREILVENYEEEGVVTDLFLYALFTFLMFNMFIRKCEISGVVLLISW